MDDTDKGLVLDNNEQCNHCHYYDEVSQYYQNIDDEDSLLKTLNKIKNEGKEKKYDCIIGLSGGVDSSYVVYLAYKYQLKPLVVHLDNGWNSNLAVKNVNNIIKTTNFDFISYKVDFEEFLSIQRAYLESNVIDVEVPSDMAIISIIKKIALQYKINYILSGLNIVTELTMGKDWNFSKMDRSNFNAIIKSKKITLNTFPYFTPREQLLYKLRDVQEVNILQYVHYDSSIIKEKLKSVFGWEDYSIKHGESIFTLFYQCIYLPKKFNVDKRKAHLSDLIRIGEVSREQALKILETPVLQGVDEAKLIDFVLQKLGYTYKQYENILLNNPTSHYVFPVNAYYGSIIDRFFEFIIRRSKLTTMLKLIYGKIYSK